MQILDRLWGAHTRNLERSLDRTSQRHGLVADNLAHANVPGHRRQDVEFGIELETASRTLDTRSRRGRGGAVRSEGGVDLEREVVALAETELRYQYLTTMASQFFAGLRNVIREGR
jgi:flagellar basal body rod protein FlgB